MRKETTDKDDRVTLSGAELSSLGTIRVDFFRGTRGQEISDHEYILVNADLGVASEKGKKLVIYKT
jgi:hypothetical protein